MRSPVSQFRALDRGAGRFAVPIAVVLQLLAPGMPATAQQLAGEMLYTSVQPCRIFDTRLQAAGAMAANTTRAFHVVGNTNDFVAQGGRSGGCDIPGFVGGAPRALAVMINLTAIDPQGKGHLRAYPTDAVAAPLASALNFANVGLNIANGLAVPLRQDSEGEDLTILAAFATTHVVADVVGFFSPAKPRRYYLTTTFHAGDAALTACAEGFRMAVIWDILDPTNLAYDDTLGALEGDTDKGPPSRGAGGWIRTGGSPRGDVGLGRANCFGWTSALSVHNGSIVYLDYSWDAPANLIAPWQGLAAPCDNALRVWCVED
jgi:hypothetical protein